MARLVVLDANVLIAVFDPQDAHHQWAVNLLKDTLDYELLVSSLTYAETLVGPTRAGRGAKFTKALGSLGIEFASLTPDDAVSLAHTRADSGLRMPDAVVLHLAQQRSAALATADATVAKVATARGVTVFAP